MGWVSLHPLWQLIIPLWSQYRWSLSQLLLCCWWFIIVLYTCEALQFTIGLYIYCYFVLSKGGAQSCSAQGDQIRAEQVVCYCFVNAAEYSLAADSFWACNQLRPQTLVTADSCLFHHVLMLVDFLGPNSGLYICCHFYYLLLFIEPLLYIRGRHFR